MVDRETLEIKIANIDLLNQFLKNAGSSLKTFRYFEKRNPDVIQNHIITNILIKDFQAIGYCHLEREMDKVWLGIAIVESQLGMGYGLYLMNSLIDIARNLKITMLHLTVDKVNLGAINLYEKVGFKIIKEINQNSFLMIMNL